MILFSKMTMNKSSALYSLANDSPTHSLHPEERQHYLHCAINLFLKDYIFIHSFIIVEQDQASLGLLCSVRFSTDNRFTLHVMFLTLQQVYSLAEGLQPDEWLKSMWSPADWPGRSALLVLNHHITCSLL